VCEKDVHLQTTARSQRGQ